MLTSDWVTPAASIWGRRDEGLRRHPRARVATGFPPGRGQPDGGRLLRPRRRAVPAGRRTGAEPAGTDRPRRRLGGGAARLTPLTRAAVPERLRGRQPRAAGTRAASSRRG